MVLKKPVVFLLLLYHLHICVLFIKYKTVYKLNIKFKKQTHSKLKM